MAVSSDEKIDAKLLYVEDDRDVQKMVARVIKRMFPQINILLAENGQKGLELFALHHPDIVLTDIRMPVMNGIQMAREIRTLDKGARIIVITVSSDTDFILEAIDIGVNSYVLKPIKMENFSSAINRCLDEIKLERQLHRQNDYIHRIAYYDPLTGLPNRQLLDEFIHQALAQAQRHNQNRLLAVLYLDLDRFKAVNDTLGHSIGDQLLHEVALRLKQCCRRDRDTVARWGGDEFVILLPEIDTTQEAVRVAQKIVDELAQPFDIFKYELSIGACIGISIYPEDGADGETLIKNADRAMYRAKKQGGNRYHLYNPSLDVLAAQRLIIEKGLHSAMHNGEFSLNYQPKVNTTTGQVVGIEALLRWHHPELGSISPRHFIPIAEETGFIVPLSEWVLRTACNQNKAWQGALLPPARIAVNFSPCQFQGNNLAAMVENVLTETNLDPCWLELEVTEGVMLQDMKTVVNTLRRLNSMGVHIALDNFGTGHSSFNCFKELPIHTLKLDKSFVDDLAVNSKNATIATAVINLAQSFKLDVVAEGVESIEQVRFLASHNCTDMQGYFFGEPRPAEEVSFFHHASDWLKQ